MDADLFLDAEPARPSWQRWLSTVDPRHWLGTLKARLAAGVLLVLLAGMGWMAWQMGQVAERGLLVQAGQREQNEAQRAAAMIGRRLAQLQHALGVVAARIDPALLDDDARLEAFLRGESVLMSMFQGFEVVGPDGQVRMSIDPASTHPSSSVADRTHVQRALAERRGQISGPLPGSGAEAPVIAFAQPLLFDGQGRGVLVGVLRLTSRDLLAELAEARDDDAGTLVVVTDGVGTIVAHPQQAILTRPMASEPRLRSAHAQWTAEGRPLQRDAGHWAGGDDVVAMAGEGTGGWHVWRAVPRAGLLAPLYAGRDQALRQAAVAAALLAAAVVAFLAWQLRPLRQLQVRAQRMLHGGSDAARDDWPQADGEIGELARTLRHVWAERTQVESFNAEVLGKLSSVMAAAPVGIAFTRHGRFELVSAELCRLVARPQDHLLGQPTSLIFASDEDPLALGPQVAAAFGRGEAYVGEWQLRRGDGAVFWARLRARPVAADDAAAGTIWSVNDISDQVHKRQQLEHAALHDALTGVCNRKGFELAMAHVFGAPATQRPASVVMIDLDHFKPINDSAGHAAGDAVLVAVAQALVAQVRASDTVARLGGDEFALLLPRCDQAQALRVADKARRAICELALPWDGRLLRVGASLGVAELGHAHADPAQWLAAADAACYGAKRSGRGAVRTTAALQRVGADA